jgi:imidazolonepropionase
MSVKIYTGINKAYTFKGFVKKRGVHPNTSDYSVVKDAALVVGKNGLFEWVGPLKKLDKKSYPKAKVYDLGGLNVYPSFTESHTHLAFGGDRKKEFEQKVGGATYLEIQKSGGGINKTIADTKKLSFKELLKKSQIRVDNFKAQGVSLLEIKSGYGQDLKTEKKQLDVIFNLKGIKITPTYLALHCFKGDKESYVDRVLNNDLKRMVKNFPELKRVDLFVEKSFFDLSDLERLVKSIKDYGLSFCAHADQLSSLGGSLKAAELGALSVEHAVHMKDSEIKKLSKFDTVVNLLPGADFYLKTEYPKARKMIDEGLKVSLATDFNPGSSPTQDINFIGLLARRNMGMTLPEVFCAYTYNASCALGVFNKGALQREFVGDFFATKAEPEDFFYEVGGAPGVRLYQGRLVI